jgi:glycosyltransferase involved in cell wall biosynthesis
MTDSPTVSVLVPTYNYAGYLPETIASIEAQDLDRIEIIVADDHSTDSTPEVMAPIADRNPAIRYVRHKKNKGMVENWNWCLNQASGTYVLFLLADDKLNDPSALRRMTDALDRVPGSAMAASARCIIDSDSNEIEVVRPVCQTDRVLPGKLVLHQYLNRDHPVTNPIGEPSAVLFRRSFASRGFDESYRQLVDMEMWCHLLQQGDLIYFQDPLCCFRRHDKQQTRINQLSYRHQIEEIRLCQRYTDEAVLKYVLFQKLHRISKIDHGELNRTVKKLRKQYTPSETILYTVRYQTRRRMEKTVTSVRKRIPRGRVHLI